MWIADPSEESLKSRSDDPYDFSGCFLYLITPLYDDVRTTTFYSGCSALQVISNLANGSPFITVDQNEPLGRNDYAHPTDKLRSIGGIIIDRRPIDVLYKPRYMTDEQSYCKDGQVYRVHDLLGYPIYVSNPFESLAKRALTSSEESKRRRRPR